MENYYFIDIENKLLNILNNERITEIKANEFKQSLKDMKEIIGKTLSKQYFLNGLSRDKAKNINLKLNRIIKKANIKVDKGFYYSSKITSQKGFLYNEKSRKVLSFLIV
jgi:hypothetical protein